VSVCSGVVRAGMAKERTNHLSLASVTISYFIHSTEDARKLNGEICAEFGLDEPELNQEELEGHYGNKLTFVKAHLTNMRAADIFQQIASRLTPSTRQRLSRELEKSMDEHDALYLRLDRQTLIEGLSLSDEEPIRVKLKPKLRSGGRQEMASVYKKELKLQCAE